MLFVLTGCGSSDLEETPTSEIRATIGSPTPQIQARATSSATPTMPRPTRTIPVHPTFTREFERPLEPGWRRLGDELFGLEAAVPGEWSDASRELRSTDLIERYGPQMLLLVDSEETAKGLLSGQGLDEGAFLFAFTLDAVPANRRPEETLQGILGLGEPPAENGSDLIGTVESITIGRSPAAYVDLSSDPLANFALDSPSIHYRYLLVMNPEIRTPAVFLIGTTVEEWNTQTETFTNITELVEIRQTAANSFKHLGSGDVVQGSLTQAFDHVWTFSAEGGGYATITLTPEDEHLDLTLALLDPDGSVIATVDDGYAGEAEVQSDLLLTESGTYVLEVSEFFNEAGQYRLSLLLSDQPSFDSGGFIDFGQEVTAELLPDSRHTWYFEGTAGQSATVILSSLDERFDVILEIRSPDDRLLVVLDEGFVGDAEVLTGYELPLTGRYTIFVRGFAGHGGLYALSLDEGSESTANFFDVGDIIYGDRRQELLRKDEAHAWFFNGRMNDEVTILVTPLEPTLDLDVWLLDPNLQELVMQDENLAGEYELISSELPVDGQYLILVRDFFGEPGAYEISINASGINETEIAGTLVYSQTVSGNLIPGSREAWSFSGEEGDVIDILVTPSERDRDLVLLLIDPDGNTAITVDAALANSPERLVAFELDSSGTWTIVVKEFFNEGSAYELLLTRQIPADEPDD